MSLETTARWSSPLTRQSPNCIPPAPPSSPNVPLPPPLHLDSARPSQHPRVDHDAFLQKTKSQFLDLTELPERWLDALDLDVRTQLYRSVLISPETLRLPNDEVGIDSSSKEKPLMFRPVPLCLWNMFPNQRNSGFRLITSEEAVSDIEVSIFTITGVPIPWESQIIWFSYFASQWQPFYFHSALFSLTASKTTSLSATRSSVRLGVARLRRIPCALISCSKAFV